MSGGVALYVWDPLGRFGRLCNVAMVDPESGRPEGRARPRRRPPEASLAQRRRRWPWETRWSFDPERLRILIERHHRLTGSARAAALLDDWDATLAAFVKVTPRDYRRALEGLAKARAAAAAVAAE